jgi:hypothetical protein
VKNAVSSRSRPGPVAPTTSGSREEEVPDDRAISGVETSITAFLGRARRGPTHRPVRIEAFEDFERVFGGLDNRYPLGYALRDFFLNGGSQAIVVRIPPSGRASSKGHLTAADILGREEDGRESLPS